MFEEIRDMVAEQLGIDPEEIKIDTDLMEELDCDSLDLFQLVSDAEDKYEVKFEDLENLKTIGDLIKVIEG
ncbi:MAG: acyl carrier protein [Lachnospirales bacterium]